MMTNSYFNRLGMYSELSIFLRCFIMFAVVQLTAGLNDIIDVCLGPHCYTAPTRNSEHASKSKADAAQWCRSREYGELAAINSQSEQDDIDRVRFSEPDLVDDSYYIETKATFTIGGVVCWPSAQGMSATSTICETSTETMRGLVVQKDTQSALMFKSDNLQVYRRFICQVSRKDEANCPAGLFSNGNFCFNYSANTEQLRWFEARRRCMQQGGGDLAYIGVDSLILGNASQWPGLPHSAEFWTGVRTVLSPQQLSAGDTIENIKRAWRTGNQNDHVGRCPTLSLLPGIWATANCAEVRRFICRSPRGATAAKGEDTTLTTPVTTLTMRRTALTTKRPQAPTAHRTDRTTESALPDITPDGRYTTAMDFDLNPAGSGSGGGAMRGHDGSSTQTPAGHSPAVGSLGVVIIIVLVFIIVTLVLVGVLLWRRCRRTLAAAEATDRANETVRPPDSQSPPAPAADPHPTYTPVIEIQQNGAMEGSGGGMKAIYASVPNATLPEDVTYEEVRVEAVTYEEVRFEASSTASTCRRQVTPRAVANNDVIVAYESVP